MIPVLRPKLPEAERILPYLKQMDASRWYSNYGPLVNAFELRAAEMLHAASGQTVMVANGTVGLTVALQALNVARGSCCLMPSWTFTATPAAAIAAGLQPYFLDVDKITQALSPEQVKVKLEMIKEEVGAVIAVAPYGAPVDVAAWDRFTQETGIPVVIDAAAGFDALAG
ncbi:MAG: DegT/DnrJ/EryC1/StrS family aminotransferase, partial [Rickettsiales bacterium]|nr:DegT/DnrJ/EryC1/StrS family aminotransferase [Rickettsiales bacterium]